MKKRLYLCYMNIKKACRAFFFRLELKKRNDFSVKNSKELNLLMRDRAYLDDLEVPILSKYASKAKDTIVEIGCAFGGSSALLLSSKNSETRLHSIDPFVKDSMGPLHATKEKCKKNVKKAITTLKKQNSLQQWALHDDYSYNVAKTWSEPIDMIFIDGDHNYDAVKKDFENWFPFVKKDGFILFHDSRKEEGTPEHTHNKGWPGPTKLAKELLKDERVKLIDEAYSITVWKKA